MGLLHDIIANLLDEKSPVGTALLKLWFLAGRLGSHPLEDWVRHELEGYEKDSSVPEYRTVGITYSGTFTNGAQVLNDTPIPLHIIKKNAGDAWIKYELRDGMAVIDEAVRKSHEKNGGTYGIDCGNLMLLLTDNFYKGFTCVSAHGVFDVGAFIRIQTTVRAKALDLCMKIEREIPLASEIVVGPPTTSVTSAEVMKITKIVNQTFNGPYTAITSSGAGTNIQITVEQGDSSSLTEALVKQGLNDVEAIELAEIVSSETPTSEEEPFGAKAKAWITEKAAQGAGGIWKLGLDVAKDMLRQYLKQYYFG
jgi:hypothetical protein